MVPGTVGLSLNELRESIFSLLSFGSECLCDFFFFFKFRLFCLEGGESSLLLFCGFVCQCFI